MMNNVELSKMVEIGPRAGDIRTRIVASAIQLINDRGYAATSVSDIVQRAGTTKGAFYHYFDSKSACLRELHKSFIEGELHRLQTAVDSTDGPTSAIRAIFRSFLFGVEQFHDLSRIFDQEWRHIEEEGFEEIRHQRDRIEAIVTEQLALGQAQGQFDSATAPKILALAIIGMCGWAHRWYHAEGPLSYADIADSWADAFLAGIQLPSPA